MTSPPPAPTRTIAVRTLAILRGRTVAEAIELADRSWEAGIDLVEVPVQNETSWQALVALVARADGRAVGAGTVTSPDRARRAIDAGVEVLITPGLDDDVVSLAQDAGITVLPGVMSPTEVQRAGRLGAPACKLFPIGALGTGYLQALRPVFPEMELVMTGGVGVANAEELVAAGANALAFGGGLEAVLTDPSAISAAAAITRPWNMAVRA